MNKLNQVYRFGRDAALTGCVSIDDCPYADNEMTEKRAWVLGFIDGLRALWTIDSEHNKG